MVTSGRIVSQLIVKCKIAELGDQEVDSVTVNCQQWIKARNVARILGYTDTEQAIRTHVSDNDKQSLEQLIAVTGLRGYSRKSTFINSAGLRQLVVKSNLPNATQVTKALGMDVQKIH
jgi:prophage antirepressor-like protein